jgi:hypothetical protein
LTAFSDAENPLRAADPQYNAFSFEELEACRLKLLGDEKEIIRYGK